MSTATAIPVPPIDQFSLETWFERDRARVALQHTDTGITVIEWLDDAVGEAIEDGFLDGKAFIMGRLRDAGLLKRSAYEYAQGMTVFHKLARRLERERLKAVKAEERALRLATPQGRRRGKFTHKDVQY